MEDIRTTLKPGVIFAGKYRIERVLGEGGMGIVLAAIHGYTNDRVALKFLLPEAAENADVKTRFLNEARAAVQIKSEHVGRVTDVDVLPSGVPYMVMEYLEGHDLGEVVAQNGGLPLATAADYLLQACEALAEAHALGIVHRDLKPSNLFLTRRKDGSALVKVLDFGISKLGTVAPAAVQLTKTANMMGSPLYMSPEQMTNPKGVDSRSDVWSMGVVLYELLTGNWPFLSETVQGLAVEIITQPYQPIRSLRADLPEELERLVARCLEKVPAARYGSVGELARALAPFASAAQSAVSVDRVSRVLFGQKLTIDPASARISAPAPAPRSVQPPAPASVQAQSAAPRRPPAAWVPTQQSTTNRPWASTNPQAGDPASEDMAKTIVSARDKGGQRAGIWPLIGVASLLIAAVAVGFSFWKSSAASTASELQRAPTLAELPSASAEPVASVGPAASSAPARSGLTNKVSVQGHKNDKAGASAEGPGAGSAPTAPQATTPPVATPVVTAEVAPVATPAATPAAKAPAGKGVEDFGGR